MTSEAAAPPSTTSPPATSEPTLSPAAAQRERKAKGPFLMDITRKLPNAPPRLMAAIEGWGYDSLGDQQGKTFIVTGRLEIFNFIQETSPNHFSFCLNLISIST